MAKTALILGSTGMIGQGALLECIKDSRIDKIKIIVREAPEHIDPKVEAVTHTDFFNLDPISEHFKGIDLCLFCIGVSSAGMSEEQYTKLTYDLTINVANELIKQSPQAHFVFISGAGSDRSEKGRTMWARVKGKAENVVLNMPFEVVHTVRPGYIQPFDGIKSRTPLYQKMYSIFKFIYPLIKPIKSVVTDTQTLGKAMIEVGLNGYEKDVLESQDINKFRA
ncbi:NAD(P)H-binding protein [bacterium]|nr:NAD(P)H-binding protein [bacterium]